jgi:hypothetical protein
MSLAWLWAALRGGRENWGAGGDDKVLYTVMIDRIP